MRVTMRSPVNGPGGGSLDNASAHSANGSGRGDARPKESAERDGGAARSWNRHAQYARAVAISPGCPPSTACAVRMAPCRAALPSPGSKPGRQSRKVASTPSRVTRSLIVATSAGNASSRPRSVRQSPTTARSVGKGRRVRRRVYDAKKACKRASSAPSAESA
jgi:hypothetical protein